MNREEQFARAQAQLLRYDPRYLPRDLQQEYYHQMTIDNFEHILAGARHDIHDNIVRSGWFWMPYAWLFVIGSLLCGVFLTLFLRWRNKTWYNQGIMGFIMAALMLTRIFVIWLGLEKI